MTGSSSDASFAATSPVYSTLTNRQQPNGDDTGASTLNQSAYSSVPHHLSLQVNTQHRETGDALNSASPSQPPSASSSISSASPTSATPLSPLHNFHSLLALSPSGSANSLSSSQQLTPPLPAPLTLPSSPSTPDLRSQHQQQQQQQTSASSSNSASSSSPSSSSSSLVNPSSHSSNRFNEPLAQQQAAKINRVSSHQDLMQSNAAASSASVASNSPPPATSFSSSSLSNASSANAAQRVLLPNFQSSAATPVRTTPAATNSNSAAGSGFFSSFFSSNNRAASNAAGSRAPQRPPLVVYMERLKSCHQNHLKKINALSDLKGKFEQKSVEEIAQWNAWSQAPLAVLAANFYTIHMAYVNTLLGLEGRFMANIERHIMVANAVCDHRYSEKMIEKEMFSSTAEQLVRTPEEIDALFWPSDAEEVKNLCRSVGEALKKVEAVHAQMSEKGKRRETVVERTKRLADLIQKALAARDSLEVDTFHHHPIDLKSQLAFNHLMCDQRGDEGKFVKQFMDFQALHRARMNNAALLSFINQLIKLIFKTYRFDERWLPIVRLYCDRLIFPRVPELMATVVPKEEKSKSASLASKLDWLRTLTPQQLGVTEDLMPPGFHHALYTPLYTPPGSAVVPPPTAEPSTAAPAHVAVPSPSPPSFNEDNPLAPPTRQSTPLVPVREASPSLPPPRQASPAPHVDGNNSPPLLSTINVAALSDLSFLSREETLPPPLQTVSDDFPYAEAINLLTQLNSTPVPFDIFYRVVQSVRAVFTCAKRYMRANRIARAKAQNRQLAHEGDPFAQFMSKLVDESSQEIKKLEDNAASPLPHANGNGHGPVSLAADAAAFESPPAAVASSPAAAISASGLPPVSHFYAPSLPPALPTPTPALPEREEEETPLNADDLFPLMIWLVIHANVPNIIVQMGNIDRFVPPDLKTFGDAGYCVSQVEAVLFYLEELTPENLGKEKRPNFEEEEEEDRTGKHKFILSVQTSQRHEQAISSPAQIISSPSANNNLPTPQATRPTQHSNSVNDLSMSSSGALMPTQ